eukprot:1191528-Prorocentrum_minimum.AAC.2
MSRSRNPNITSFYGSSCANNGKDALNTPESRSWNPINQRPRYVDQHVAGELVSTLLARR